ncbi:arabinan endo-1,5-alpha-L-arabinosidase [Carboxylicivirga linearis]|uniref:Family 43 glycosylhydrolase n=1 Tax=Carboxylicivirga linearis TaxID=1628157 RepID=A0ABS5JXY1_9BACT|nr:arabinan endo-1,5-alpha-L-arabinosidase [Carboxylicivirga linearis]MBS2099790.1 family 43 glycosylhydrolase [Carboxylicivirga linearis]
MKYIPYILLCAFGLQACTMEVKKEEKKNPYTDDYTNISSLSHRHEWNAANVHDPSCVKVGDTYYVYATGAYFTPPNINFMDDTIHIGKLPIRSSKDLVNWKFEGWVFDQTPAEALEYVKKVNGGHAADNMWAPFIRQVGDEFRLYYSVSFFGSNASYIGMATAKSPLGPWENKGEVVKTTRESKMNAIDPSVITDHKTGKDWMMYGSFFGGLYCMELDPETGLALTAGDEGHLIARLENGHQRVIEAPEIVYNEEQDMYYLFVSYDSLFSFYNIRVGRSKIPTGPFLDYFGNDMVDTKDNYPILTHSYMFNNHPGWNGNAHNAVLNDDGKYYVMHQGRLAPENLALQMHVREIKWLSNGWPVLSPERYNIIDNHKEIKAEELAGSWEVIVLDDIPDKKLYAEGGWVYKPEAFNLSEEAKWSEDGKIEVKKSGNIVSYELKKETLYLVDENKNKIECAVFRGWDWELENETILFSGILPNGRGIWGKKVTSVK